MLPSGVAQASAPRNTITVAPPPIGYGANGPIFGSNQTLPDKYASGVQSLRWGMGTCSMSPGFDGYNAKSCSCVNRVGDWYHTYASGTTLTTPCSWTYDPGFATDVQSLGCIPQTITQLAQPYVAPTECCDKCGVAGSAVRLLYWPAQTATPASAGALNYANITAPPQPAASSGFVSDGYTFVSPSVYVLYSSIGAAASCVARVNSHIPVGTVHATAIRAYAPQALQTARCMAENVGAGLQICIGVVGALQPQDCHQGVDAGWEPINYSELENPPPDSVILQRKSSCVLPGPGFTVDIGLAKSMFLNPQLSFPTDVTDIDPMWKTWGGSTCTAINLGVIDPPRTLGQATALAPGVQSGSIPLSADCKHCAIGPGAHSAEPAMVSTPVANSPNQATAVPALAGQSAPAPAAQSPAVQPGASSSASIPSNNVPSTGNGPNTNSVNNPIVASPQQVSQPNNAGTSPNPAPAAAPAAITLQPQQPATPQAAVPQQNPSVGQAVNAPFQAVPAAAENQPASNPVVVNSPAQNAPVNNAPANNAPANNAPANSPAPTDAVPLVAAVPSVNVGGQPVFQHPNSNIVVAGNTIAPGAQSQVAGHAVSNGVDNVVVDGSTQAIAPTQVPPAAAAPLPSVGGQQIQQQGSNLIVAGQTIAPGGQGSVAGVAVVNNGNAVVIDGSSQAIQPTPVAQALPVIGGSQIQKQQNGNLVVAGSITIPQGAQTNIAGQQISNGPSQVAVNEQTFAAVPAPAPTPAPLMTDGGIVHMTNGGLEVGSQTLIPGSQVTLSGHLVDYANPSQVVVDSSTYGLAAISSAQPLVIGGQTLSRADNGGVVIAGSTVAPNGVATIVGHTYSLAGSSSIIDNGQTYSIPPTSNAYLVQAITTNNDALPTAAMTLANGMVVTPEVGAAPGANPTFRMPNGADISVGGSPVVVSGTTYSALPSGQGFLVNGKSTMALPMVTAGAMSPTPAVYTIGGQVCTANPTGFAIGSTSLSPGGPAVTVSGTVVSLDKSSHLQIGSSTMDLTSQYPVATNDVVSVGGTAVTCAPTGFVVKGSTVSPGGSAVTINGTVMSLDHSSHLQVGSSTVLLTAAAAPAAPTDNSTVSGAGLGSAGATPAGTAGGASSLPTNGFKSTATRSDSVAVAAMLVIGGLTVVLNL